ncbi:cysteine-rich repeat secretory protein 15 isoform X2 [Momordica charantia]|uniref:Cysteine-rich repeat secretory protein 15 isoform X2 n=1 Tax=Momordica charantia TaxID=3673 RepID=A0A6J1DNN9_MOMCH|nr:cysteine-rich repeat secretory protein 15 isoform X2 [Momordica charantia]
MIMRRSSNLQFHSSNYKTLLSSSLFFLLFLSNNSSSSSSSIFSHGFPIKAHVFIYAGCSNEKFQPNSPFESNYNSLLSSLVSSSSQMTYNSFAIGNDSSTISPPPEAAIFGLYQCRGDLATADCSKCIKIAATQIHLACPSSYGASLQLEGCFLRYEHFDFLGKLDTSVRFRKCSPSSSNDVEFFRRRDDVLADMQAGAGAGAGFRVSSSGLVQGFAQCLGDLSAQDCGSCLGDAVGKLKSLCGSAGAADAFLGQCYARYWASGFYPNSSDSPSDDQAGKTVAIIIGVVAALAILVVLLSVCRRAMAS